MGDCRNLPSNNAVCYVLRSSQWSMKGFLSKLSWKWVAISGLIVLIAYGIYNNPDRHEKIILSPEEQQVSDSLMAKYPQLQEVNARAKISSANLINLLNSAETNGFDIETFHFYSDNLLSISSELQTKLDEINNLLSTNRSLFEKSPVHDTWTMLTEVFEFRSNYNKKLIEFAKLGANLNIKNNKELDNLIAVMGELETMEARLPEMQDKYIQTLSKLDPDYGNWAERKLDEQKKDDQQLLK